jgi:hypothetical protein
MAVVSPAKVEFEHPTDYRDELNAHADQVRFLTIPERRYFIIAGRGAPGDASFAAAISTLYPVAYTLHFMLKKRGIDAAVGALEGQFQSFAPPWEWRLLLPVPVEATGDEIATAIEQVRAKGKAAALDELLCQPWEEGPVAQIMHVGPYDAEAPTIEQLHSAISAAGLTLRGLHHEIYISDPNRTRAGRLKTLVRQPVGPAV